MPAIVKAKIAYGDRVMEERSLRDGQAVLVKYSNGVLELFTLSASDPAINSLAIVLKDSING